MDTNLIEDKKMKNFNQKALSAMVSMLMTLTICQVGAVHASDIDIYKLPDATKLGVFMMLDLSGSMDRSNPNSGRNGACDTPSGANIVDFLGVYHPENRGYTRNYCQVGGVKTYYYFKNGTQWYFCGAAGTTLTPNTIRCSTKISAPTIEVLSAYISESNNTQYYSYVGGTRYYDRISRLKDALYSLAISDEIPPNTQIGVGTFVPNDGKRGYVVIKSDIWGEVGSAQRQKVLDLIKSSNFVGLNNTPTATSYAESAAYLLGTTTKNTTSSSYSGIGLTGAASGITIGTGASMKYISPLDKVTEPKCSGKGIYFLTDGEPNGASGSAATPMQLALGRTTGIITSNGFVNTNAVYASTAEWEYIGAFAKYLNDGTQLQQFFNSVKNNNQHTIKTAVVGFGSIFNIPEDGVKRKKMTDPKTGKERTYYDCSKLSGRDQQNACNWGMKSKFSDGTTTIAGSGGYGEGGFYSAQDTEEVVKSFVNFVDDMKPEFDPIATGTPTIPVDALNPIQLQPYGYYATFTPKPQETYQLWLGNLNKYHIFKGQLYNNNKDKPLINPTTGILNSDAYGIWGQNGMLGQLPLGTSINVTTGAQSSNRIVFTNRQINSSSIAEETPSLQRVNLETLYDADTTKAKFKNDPKKNYWLNILGYQVAENATGVTLATLPTTQQRQLGAVMHSKPILLTQEGKIVVPTTGADKGKVTTTDRKDYLLFGSTQGMLHVVNVDDGKEVFTFVPHEMMESQSKAFLSEGLTAGGKDNLYYGIDGPWTAYTQYVSKTDKTLTVKDSGRKDTDDKDLNQKGLQWVYGGLRMGGRSYYSLDLENITSPSLKFHIDPANQRVVKSDGTTTTYSELQYMGQSWSKPTITYVNWGGARRLVMLVGGGYDAGGINGSGLDASGNRITNGGYENPAYEQTNKQGGGVYMFDAGTGELLWWASANVGTSTAETTDSGIIATKEDNLKYSVVSQVNALDRDGDGLSDILYFGDLGGQAFRIDINNTATTKGGFAKRIVRLYADHQTDGTSPRFYEMPSFSVHKGVDGLFGVLALSSGNRSSPLAGTHMINGVSVTTKTANDAVYVIYDNDVARTDLYSIAQSALRTSSTSAGVSLVNATFDNLKAGIAQTTVVNKVTTYNGGWKYQYSSTAGKYKGMNELYALDGMLYVNVYHKDGTGILGDCGSGVVGDTELYQFCLPTGKCSFYDSTYTNPSKIIQGGGILGATLGMGYNNNPSDTSVVVKRPDEPNPLNCTDPINKNKPECQLFDNGARLQQLRWYEAH